VSDELQRRLSPSYVSTSLRTKLPRIIHCNVETDIGKNFMRVIDETKEIFMEMTEQKAAGVSL